MTRAAQAVFAVLVAATVAAFFVAQNLKNSPSVIQQVKFRSFFSPTQDGRFDTVRYSASKPKAD